MTKWLRSIGISVASIFLVAGSAYAVTTLSADLATQGDVRIGTGTGDEAILEYDTGANAFVVNEAGADVNFRVETDTNANGIFLDAGAETLDLVGGSGSTGCTIDASGNLTCTGNITGG